MTFDFLTDVAILNGREAVWGRRLGMSLMWVTRAGVEFGVELCPAEDAEGDDVEPEEESDGGAERAIDLGVVGKARDVPAEDECGGEPHGGGDDGAGKDALPGLLHGCSEVVDQTDDADAAEMEEREVRALARLGIKDPYQVPA